MGDDACMRLHNFIFCEKNNIPTRLDELEKSVFDDDCWQFLAINTNVEGFGVHGGDDENKLDKNGNPFLGGRQTSQEKQCNAHVTEICEGIKMEMEQILCTCPITNWYQYNNGMLDKKL